MICVTILNRTICSWRTPTRIETALSSFYFLCSWMVDWPYRFSNDPTW